MCISLANIVAFVADAWPLTVLMCWFNEKRLFCSFFVLWPLVARWPLMRHYCFAVFFFYCFLHFATTARTKHTSRKRRGDRSRRRQLPDILLIWHINSWLLELQRRCEHWAPSIKPVNPPSDARMQCIAIKGFGLNWRLEVHMRCACSTAMLYSCKCSFESRNNE